MSGTSTAKPAATSAVMTPFRKRAVVAREVLLTCSRCAPELATARSAPASLLTLILNSPVVIGTSVVGRHTNTCASARSRPARLRPSTGQTSTRLAGHWMPRFLASGLGQRVSKHETRGVQYTQKWIVRCVKSMQGAVNRAQMGATRHAPWALPIRLELLVPWRRSLGPSAWLMAQLAVTIDEKPSARNPSRPQWLSFAWSGPNVSVDDSS